MKRYVYVIVLAALMLPGAAVSKSRKSAPKSQLKSIYYHVGGGMLPGIHALAHLYHAKDGRLLLQLKGDCRDETITFEVEDSVLQRCDSIIRATKIYQSKGFYKAEFMVLDAPSMSFDVDYTNEDEDFSASGDLPTDISLGIRQLTDYLEGLRGDRMAIGHLNVWRHHPKDPVFVNTVWTNGYIEYTPDESGIDELLQHLCKRKGIAYNPKDWICEMAVGSGFSCLVVDNWEQKVMEVYNAKNTVGHTILQDAEVPGQWPMTSRQALTTTDLKDYDTDTLKQMVKETRDRERTDNMSDLENQNVKLIGRMISWRENH